MPKYLELIYPDNDEPISLVSSDGYEMPRNDFIIQNNKTNRQLNNLKPVSETKLSCSSSNNSSDINYKLLTVVLPENVKDDCTSMDALLPVNSSNTMENTNKITTISSTLD